MLRRLRLPSLVAYAGAAFAVGIGYMDPGNWATDLDAGTYRDQLLWAVLASGVAAALLQLLVVRLSLASGVDLATSIAARWRGLARPLTAVYAIAIVATELAEFVGLVIGIRMVSGIPLRAALIAAALIFLALVAVRGLVSRRFQVFTIMTTAFVALAYVVDIARLHPAVPPIVGGVFEPRIPDSAALLAVVGIIGATIMPHNLFLHSALALEGDRSPRERSATERNAVRSTVLALGVATLINGAILIVGSATGATTIERAHTALAPLVGSAAALLFGGALIAASLASTASAAFAGDVVCGDRSPIRVSLLQRRLAAIVPGALLLMFGMSASTLLVLSQVALGLALPVVVVPLLVLVFEAPLRKTRGGFALLATSSLVACGTLACDGVLVSTMLPHL